MVIELIVIRDIMYIQYNKWEALCTGHCVGYLSVGSHSYARI